MAKKKKISKKSAKKTIKKPRKQKNLGCRCPSNKSKESKVRKLIRLAKQRLLKKKKKKSKR